MQKKKSRKGTPLPVSSAVAQERSASANIHTTKEKPAVLSRAARREMVAADGVPRTTISFYRYVTIADPASMRMFLLKRLNELGALGRIYLAHEGINAQMNVPTAHFEQFNEFLQSIPEFAGVPYKHALSEGDAPSFYKLTIKVKEKIVADGITDPTFNPSNTGGYVRAREMNELIDRDDAVVVDMRNAYESERAF